MEASKAKTSSPKTTSTPDAPTYEDALDQGYLGVATDTRDDSEYTVEGSAARAEEGPPDIRVETDPEHKEATPA